MGHKFIIFMSKLIASCLNANKELRIFGRSIGQRGVPKLYQGLFKIWITRLYGLEDFY